MQWLTSYSADGEVSQLEWGTCDDNIVLTVTLRRLRPSLLALSIHDLPPGLPTRSCTE